MLGFKRTLDIRVAKRPSEWQLSNNLTRLRNANWIGGELRLLPQRTESELTFTYNIGHFARFAQPGPAEMLRAAGIARRPERFFLKNRPRAESWK